MMWSSRPETKSRSFSAIGTSAAAKLGASGLPLSLAVSFAAGVAAAAGSGFAPCAAAGGADAGGGAGAFAAGSLVVTDDVESAGAAPGAAASCTPEFAGEAASLLVRPVSGVVTGFASGPTACPIFGVALGLASGAAPCLVSGVALGLASGATPCLMSGVALGLRSGAACGPGAATSALVGGVTWAGVGAGTRA